MQQEMIEDLTTLKKILYKEKNNDEKIKIYEQIKLIVDLYSKLFGNSQDINIKKMKELANIKPLYEQKYHNEIKSIIEIFNKEKTYYQQLYHSIVDILNVYLENNNIKTQKNNVNFNVLEKILLKYDKDFYDYYKNMDNEILILNNNVDEDLLGLTCHIKHLDKCYAVSEDNIYTYIHEYSHKYQSEKINNEKIINMLIEIYPNSVELISGKLNEKNNYNYKIRYLIQLKYFLEEINIWSNYYKEYYVKNNSFYLGKYEINNKIILNSLDFDLKNLIGLISSLCMYQIYFEDKNKYLNITNDINGNINEIESIKDLHDIIPNLEINNYKKLLKDFVNN